MEKLLAGTNDLIHHINNGNKQVTKHQACQLCKWNTNQILWRVTKQGVSNGTSHSFT